MTDTQRFLFERSFDLVDGKSPEVVNKTVKVEHAFKQGFPDKTDFSYLTDPEEMDAEADLDGADQDQPPEPEKPALLYSEEDLAAVREKEFSAGKEAGREEGLRETEQTDEQKAASALSLIGERLNDLFRKQEEENSRNSKESIEFSLAVVRKLFPELSKRHGLAEIESLVTETLGNLSITTKVKLFVHETLHPDLTRKIDGLTEKTAFAGSVIVVADENVTLGDCRVEWSNGGSERDSEVLWRKIDAIVERGLENLTPGTSERNDEPGEPLTSPDA